MNVAAAIDSAADTLGEAGVAEPKREAASLLAYVLQKDTVFLIAHPEFELTADRSLLFRSVIRRRARREPFQYITGRQEFYGLEFEIAPGVLIPRPETEILVEAGAEILSTLDHPQFLELGVGSGCIAVSLLKSVQTARAEAVDISSTALALAERNAGKHDVSDRLSLKESDLFASITGLFDLIVSNPPYIDEREMRSLQPEVRLFEPHAALSGGAGGLDLIQRIVADAPRFLKAKGSILIEIGHGQADRVSELFDLSTWNSVDFIPDLQGVKRIGRAKLQ